MNQLKRQRTLANNIEYSGIGLHTGVEVSIVMKPAPVDHGVVFQRVDLADRPLVKADITNVSDVIRGTSIASDGVTINTVEHVLCALAGLGVTNVLIEMTAPEPPASDGSAQIYVELIDSVGIVEQDAFVSRLVLRRPILIKSGESYLYALPSTRQEIEFTVVYDNDVIGIQNADFEINEQVFRREFAAARTYGFLHEVEDLHRRGLALGGSTENAIVIGDEGVLNESLRFPDEFVRHKILDLVGDLFLTGLDIQARIVGYRSGHAMNFKLAKSFCRMFQGNTAVHAEEVSPMDVNYIQSVLPHRYPFLLVDRILELEPGKRAVGIKNVTMNEQFFQGHFPGQPVMPGVLIVEALAQLAGVFMLSKEEHTGKLPFFGGIDKFRFRRPVVPGDQLILEIEVLKVRGTIGKVKAQAKVDGQLACEGELLFSLVERR